jgi:DNA-binding response OmpR family regulator
MQAAKSALMQKGYNVSTLETCDLLVEKVERMQPDLILMDLLIPPMGGDNSIKLLKNNLKTKHIPILLFSGDQDIEKITSEIEANGFIKKPFNIEEFGENIENAITSNGVIPKIVE